MTIVQRRLLPIALAATSCISDEAEPPIGGVEMSFSRWPQITLTLQLEPSRDAPNLWFV